MPGNEYSQPRLSTSLLFPCCHHIHQQSVGVDIHLHAANDIDEEINWDCSQCIQIVPGVREYPHNAFAPETPLHWNPGPQYLGILHSQSEWPSQLSHFSGDFATHISHSQSSVDYDDLSKVPQNNFLESVMQPFKVTEEWMKCMDGRKICMVFPICELQASSYEQCILSQWREQRELRQSECLDLLYRTGDAYFSLYAYRDDEGVLCFILVLKWRGTLSAHPNLIAYIGATSVQDFFKNTYFKLPGTCSEASFESKQCLESRIRQIDYDINRHFEFVWAMKVGLNSGLFTPGEFRSISRNARLIPFAINRLRDRFLFAHHNGIYGKTAEQISNTTAVNLWMSIVSLCPSSFHGLLTKDNVSRAAKYLQTIGSSPETKLMEAVHMACYYDNGVLIRPQVCGMLWHHFFILKFCMDYRSRAANRPFEEVLSPFEYAKNFVEEHIYKKGRPNWFPNDYYAILRPLQHPFDNATTRLAEGEVTLLARLVPLVQVIDDPEKVSLAYRPIKVRTFDPKCADSSPMKKTIYPSNFGNILDHIIHYTSMDVAAGPDRFFLSLYRRTFMHNCWNRAMIEGDSIGIDLWGNRDAEFGRFLHNAAVWFLVLHMAKARRMNRPDVAYSLLARLQAIQATPGWLTVG